MPRGETSGEAAGGSAAAWSADVVDHRRTVGRPPYEPARSAQEPLARRGDVRILGTVGAISCVDSTGRTRWTHRCATRPNAAHLSGDRVLVTTDSLEYTPWGNLGPALLLDLADGRLVAELRGERAAARGGERFVLGLEGYDVFDTWEYDRDGNRTDAWRSYGHYVVGTGLRVVEADRQVPTNGRVVRLLPGGVVERGPRLTDPLPPEPLVLRDGTILVLDGGAVRAVGRRLDSIVLAELDGVAGDVRARSMRALRWDGDRVMAVVAEQHADEPSRCTVDTWTLALRRRA
ncbi:hypothetical protein [Streptomyces chromofuscus]|uniref:Uncharacterized protein n=1 Tax=Streptomyces chromofuscus TaxID=42881 RepID=A0A7M2TAU0_STRCW|nr:hypothetical protein [Streptomyces chromofuscus]QOV44848.1 hypothetical protein IPT68_02200 [Streptomyces chromofuscus]